MEQNFQTSFIPKKPIIENKVVDSKPVGLLTILSIFIFFSMVLTTGGFYFYKESLIKNIATKDKQLVDAKNRFEPSAIARLQLLDKRLEASSEVLSGHIAVSPIFKILQSITMKSIRYTKFSYKLAGEKSNLIDINMSGQASGYLSVALQSSLFTEEKKFIDPVFSNLSLDSKGNVIFDLKFSVQPSLVNYKQMLVEENESSPLGTINLNGIN